MGKTRTSVVLAGQEFRLTGTESSGLNICMRKAIPPLSILSWSQRAYPSLSIANCVLLASLNMADELHKLRADYDALDQRISQLRDMPRASVPASPVKRPFESKQPVNAK